MIVTPIKTHRIEPNDTLFAILDSHLPKIVENSIVAIASKIISLCENSLANQNTDKKTLIQQEADFCFPPPSNLEDFCLTLKDHRLIPNSGIDESNCVSAYIQLPQKPQTSAKKIWHYLRKRDRIKNLGIVITDSNITPLRRGVTGIALGWCGFKPLYDYTGQTDLFGRPLQVTQINLLDSLATTATLVMGEGKEQTPIVLIQDAPRIKFQNRAPQQKEERSIYIEPKTDLFSTVNFKKFIK